MNRLRELRKERGLTQKELGSEVKVPSTTLARYEVGMRSPVLPYLIALADYFNVSIDYLVGRSDVR
ncbi:helix-turn-helix domain-containing protein [Leuconostoc mesenteroides]|uniref:helix-turn-helix domain-containing protein n=1 Tax=Leuconostoc mesenteroides TaxID=1245 RepID=UPI00235DD0B0|nr:helix-turn-helix transcriptional regulator [Leuconostoc mesenteroides]